MLTPGIWPPFAAVDAVGRAVQNDGPLKMSFDPCSLTEEFELDRCFGDY